MLTRPKTESARPVPLTPGNTEDVRHPIAEWTVTVLLLLFGTTTALQAYVVPSSSMEKTILIGDQMIVDKLAYSPPSRWLGPLLPYQEIKRGDIIVFRYPLDIKQNYIKRAIGIPGDRIRFENSQLILNGKRVDEPYVQHTSTINSEYLRSFPSGLDLQLYPRGMQMLSDHIDGNDLVIPPDHYLAIGDNRENSEDSRFWGLVPRENIIGKPVLIFWSYDAPGSQLQGGLLNPTHAIDVMQHFFTRTRWERTLKLVRPYLLQ